MKRAYGLIPLAAITLAGCTSATSSATGTAPTPNPAASAAFSSAAAARSSAAAAISSAASSAAAAPCTTKTCIAQDAEGSLPGLVAQDESVITRAACYKRTVVHHAAAGAWTVECKVDYSDGTSRTGYANLLLGQNKITWEPVG